VSSARSKVRRMETATCCASSTRTDRGAGGDQRVTAERIRLDGRVASDASAELGPGEIATYRLTVRARRPATSVRWLGSLFVWRALKLRRLSGRPQLAVDLGTANTVVVPARPGRRAVRAFDRCDRRTQWERLRRRAEARRMIGRTPAHISATRPLRDGVIAISR